MELVVRELWRYPVKSMGGERLEVARLDARGPHADRLWATYDLELGATTTARRLPDLLRCSARFADEPPDDAGPGRAAEVVVTFPDGAELSSSDPRVHERLSELVGRRVELRPLPPVADRAGYRTPLPSRADLRRQFAVADGEPFPDLTTLPVRKLAELARYATPVGSFADAYPLHLLTTGSLGELRAEQPAADFDVRRFRPNVVLDGPADPGWWGATLAGEDVRLAVVCPTVRCSMAVREQPGLPAQPDVLRTLSRHHDRCLGAYAEVRGSGTLREGATLALATAEPEGRGLRLVRGAARRAVRAGTRVAFGARRRR